MSINETRQTPVHSRKEVLLNGRHDTQHDGTQHKGTIRDTQHNNALISC
jgi:hypothetical protein